MAAKKAIAVREIKTKKLHHEVKLFADWTGLEPATSAVTGRHSNRLNYQSNEFNVY